MSRTFEAVTPTYLQYNGTTPVTAAPFTVSWWAMRESANDIIQFWMGDKDVDDRYWAGGM